MQAGYGGVPGGGVLGGCTGPGYPPLPCPEYSSFFWQKVSDRWSRQGSGGQETVRGGPEVVQKVTKSDERCIKVTQK